VQLAHRTGKLAGTAPERRPRSKPAAMSAPPPNLTDALVFSYLQKRGYSAAAAALPPSAKLPAASDAERERAAAMASEMAVANRITLFEGADDFIGSYQRLRDWVHGSLDLYKVRCAAPPRHAGASGHGRCVRGCHVARAGLRACAQRARFVAQP
jgi:hypothetical protein